MDNHENIPQNEISVYMNSPKYVRHSYSFLHTNEFEKMKKLLPKIFYSIKEVLIWMYGFGTCQQNF
jgi:hypothetical protein